MPKRIFFIVFLMLIQYPGLPQNAFEFTYSTQEDDMVGESALDNDGNIVLVGRIGNVIEQTGDAFIMKVFPDGSYLEKRFVRQDTSSLFSMINILNNGNYFVTGSLSADGDIGSRENFWIVIMDPDFDIIDEKYYTVPAGYLGFGGEVKSLIDNDGNIALVSTAIRQYTHYQVNDFLLYKFTQSGDSLLSRLYPTFPEAWPHGFFQMPGTDSLLLFGRGYLQNGTESMNFMDKDMNISHGISLSFLQSSDIYGNNIWLNNTDFLTLGNRIVSGNYSISFNRMRKNGQLMAELQLDRPDTIEYRAILEAMVLAGDSVIYIGAYQSYNLGWTTIPSTSVLYMADMDMNLIGRANIGGDANCWLWGIIATPDNGVLAYGSIYTESGSFASDIHVWKLRRKDFEIITKVVEMPEGVAGAPVWPNPAHKVLNISLAAFMHDEILRLRIFDASAQKYIDKQIKVTGNSLEVELTNLPNSVYIYELETNTGIKQTGKFLKQ